MNRESALGHDFDCENRRGASKCGDYVEGHCDQWNLSGGGDSMTFISSSKVDSTDILVNF